MKAIFSYTVLVVFYFVSCYFGYKYGKNIAYSDQLDLYHALRNTSAIVFGVMGAWIAIIYPDALSKIFNKDNSTKNDALSQINKLLTTMVISTLIVAIVLMANILAPLIKQISFSLTTVDSLRGISYVILITLTYLQLYVLLIALVPADSLKNNLENTQRRITRRNKMFSHAQKERKSTD